MTENDKLQMFEDQMIRTAWDETKEEWYFSIVDVVKALTEQSTPRGASNYWAKLKERLKSEGASELLTNCQQLKLKAADGKRRLTDVATTEQLLRIIQSFRPQHFQAASSVRFQKSQRAVRSGIRSPSGRFLPLCHPVWRQRGFLPIPADSARW
jgi:hypothetical protein